MHRSTHRYASVRSSQAALRQKVRDLARSRIRYGYRRIHVLLKREGLPINKKRVYRLYREEGLQIRVRRPRRHVTAANRQRFRALTVVDVFTRECLAIEPGQSLGGAEVVNVLRWIAAVRRAPKRIYCDNVLPLESTFFGHKISCADLNQQKSNMPYCNDDCRRPPPCQ